MKLNWANDTTFTVFYTFSQRGNGLGWSTGKNTLQFLYNCQLRIQKIVRNFEYYSSDASQHYLPWLNA